MLAGMFSMMGSGGALGPAESWAVADMANTWWVRPVAAQYGSSLYVGGVDRAGNYKVSKLAGSGAISSFTLATHTTSDDHNAPSITRLANGKLLSVYTRHGADNNVRYRISTNANDISAWDAEQTLAAGGPASYSQVWVDASGNVHMFYRVQVYQWAHRRSTDNGVTWSAQKILFSVVATDFLYIATTPSPASADVLRLAIVGHPTSSADHNIYYGEINLSTGAVSRPGGASLVNLYDGSAAIAPSALELVYDATTAGVSVRMFDLGGAADPQILFLSFTTTLNGNYREARRVGGVWTVSGTIVAAGAPMDNPPNTNHYFSGMAATTDANTLYLTRQKSDGDAPLERYTYSGATWTLAETVAAGDWRNYRELFRPMVPYGATTTPVVAMAGSYTAFSGAANHTNFNTSIVLDPAQEPAFSGTVLYSQAFTGLTPATTVTGWTMLAKSAGVTGETFTAQNTVDYFGGTYGRMYHTGGASAVLWGVTGSSATNVDMRADLRSNKTNSGFGLIARWVDSNNRIVGQVNYSTGQLEILERVAGTVYTTGTAISGFTSGDAVSVRMVVNGSTATAYVYRNGLQLATVARSLTASPVAGVYGAISSAIPSEATNVHTQIQRLLVTAP